MRFNLTNGATPNTQIADIQGDEFLIPWERIDNLGHLRNKRVVLINGAFDLLHEGHMMICHVAREVAGGGGIVVAAVDSDLKLQQTKGGGRPVNSFVRRWRTLSFQPVDFVVEITSDEDFLQLVNLIRPTYRIQSDERRATPSRIPNIPVIVVPRIEGSASTTDLIRRIKRVVDSQ